MKTRRLLVVMAAIAISFGIAATEAVASPPSSATHLSVTNGATTAGVNAHLKSAASIAGTITAAAGGVVSTSVTVYLNGSAIGSGFTDASGHYIIGGLNVSTTGYAVCVDGRYATGGSSTTGYLGRCYPTADFNGTSVPAGATLVKLTTSQHKTGVNLALPSGAALSGLETSAAHAAIPSALVYAQNRSSGVLSIGFTDGNGKYSIKGLTASATGYSVCFVGTTLGTTGTLPRCFDNKPWNGLTPLPSSATSVSVTVGHVHTGINGTVPNAGAIQGRVTDAASSAAIYGDSIAVFDSAGKYLTGSYTDSTGHYTVKGLAAATADKVCAVPVSVSSTDSYSGSCWKNIVLERRPASRRDGRCQRDARRLTPEDSLQAEQVDEGARLHRGHDH